MNAAIPLTQREIAVLAERTASDDRALAEMAPRVDDAGSHLRNALQILLLVDDRMTDGDGYVFIHITEIAGIANRIAAALSLIEPPRTVERPMGVPA